MSETQIGALITGVLIMFFFGYGWSLETLRAKYSLYRLIKTGNRYSIIIGLHFVGLLVGLIMVVLCTTPFGDKLLATDNKNEKNKFPNYVLFLDTSIIKNEENRIDKKALLLLNAFLERTKAKIVVISNDRFQRNLLINHKIEILKLICSNYGIKGVVIGSIPYTKGLYTRHQEIKLWISSTKAKYDNCAIIDKNPHNTDNIIHTISVDKLLTSRHLFAVVKVLDIEYDPNIFIMRTQKYGKQRK